MSLYLLLALPLALRGVSAHGYVEAWTVNGVRKDGFQPSYPPRFPNSAERPTDNKNHEWADYKSPIVACGGMSAGTGLETWPVDAGSTITAHWESWPDSHVGPVIEYMAACPATGCDCVDAASLSWFKIAEESWDGSQWAGYKIFQNKDWSFNVPANLQAGPYLVRHEIIALHTVEEDGIKLPQVYPVCIQVDVQSEGSAVPLPEELTTFPEAYTINTDFEEVNIYYHPDFDFNDFVAPGPPVASLGGTGTGSSPAPAPSSSSAGAEPVPSASASSAAGTPVDPTAAPVLVADPSDSTAAPSSTQSAPASSASTDSAAAQPNESAARPTRGSGGGRGNGYCRGGSRPQGGRPKPPLSASSDVASTSAVETASAVETSAVSEVSSIAGASLTDVAAPVETDAAAGPAEDAAVADETVSSEGVASAEETAPADEYTYKRRTVPAGAHQRRSRAVKRTF